jgi:integrase
MSIVLIGSLTIERLDMPFTKQKQVIESPAFAKFLDSLEGMDDDTIKDYRNKVRPFVDFCKAKYAVPIDQIVKEIKTDERDRYDVISDYKTHLSRDGKEANNLRALVKKARSFLEYQGIEYSDRQFKIRVKLPRTVKRKKQPIKKETIRELVRTAPNIWLKTLLLFVAATGMRPIEAMSIRHKDLDLTNEPGRATIRAEFTKMKVERYTFLTSELVQQVKDLLAYKHRERDLACRSKDGKTYSVDLKPKVRPNDLLFAIYRRDETAKLPKVQSLYNVYNNKLNSMLDTMGLNEKEDDGRRRKITEYSLRRFVKSTISNAGFGDFSEWFIGHKHSEYWEVDDEEKIDVFNRIEDRLMYLDISLLEQKGADVQSQIEQKDRQMQMMQEQMGLMMAYMTESDSKKKAEISRKLIEKGYMPRT